MLALPELSSSISTFHRREKGPEDFSLPWIRLAFFFSQLLWVFLNLSIPTGILWLSSASWTCFTASSHFAVHHYSLALSLLLFTRCFQLQVFLSVRELLAFFPSVFLTNPRLTFTPLDVLDLLTGLQRPFHHLTGLRDKLPLSLWLSASSGSFCVPSLHCTDSIIFILRDISFVHLCNILGGSVDLVFGVLQFLILDFLIPLRRCFSLQLCLSCICHPFWYLQRLFATLFLEEPSLIPQLFKDSTWSLALSPKFRHVIPSAACPVLAITRETELN